MMNGTVGTGELVILTRQISHFYFKYSGHGNAEPALLTVGHHYTNIGPVSRIS